MNVYFVVDVNTLINVCLRLLITLSRSSGAEVQ